MVHSIPKSQLLRKTSSTSRESTREIYAASNAAVASDAASAAAHNLATPSQREACYNHRCLKTMCKSTFLLRLSLALALFLAYVWLRPDTFAYLSTHAHDVLVWVCHHPEDLLYRIFDQLKIERLLVTASITWLTTYLATHFTSESHVLSQFANRVSIQINFLTKNPITNVLELDWVTTSEEALPHHTLFSKILAKARKQPPALPNTCELLCPLNLRGLLPGDLPDEMLYSFIANYASSKLLNNLGVNHTLAGLPVQVSDVIICLTFERDDCVGYNPLGRKMRLLCVSKEDLLLVFEHWCSKNKTRTMKVPAKAKGSTKSKSPKSPTSAFDPLFPLNNKK